MSSIDDAFAQSRIDFGLKQKPNWNGTVYGSCQTKGCGNHHKVGYYEGGFCKKCSRHHPDDKKKHVIATQHTSMGWITFANPKIRWITKIFVKDLSHSLSGSERADFYMTPEQRVDRLDRVDYVEKYDPNEGISTPKVKGRKPGIRETEWYE